MDYVVGPLILYSQDKIRMLDFLSDVFEFDVDTELDLVLSGTFNLKLVELCADDIENFQSSGIKFKFKLKTIEQLKEILSKYNFFQYRKEDKSLSEEICIDETSESSLSIKDIDGRIWQFDVENLQ